MYHYVYKLNFNNGMEYIGVHSTTIKPELDTTYLGSGIHLPPRCPNTCKKTILNTFETRAEAVKYEYELIDSLGCVKSDKYYNARNWNYDKFGQTKETHENILSMSEKLTGRTKETHEYIRKSSEKMKKYVGDNRTPAQIEGSKRQAEKVKGVLNKDKGKPGIANNGFKPWYFITPYGELTIVRDVTKRDYAERLGLSPRQMEHRFHFTNINKPAKRGVCKGYIFGNLEDLGTGEA